LFWLGEIDNCIDLLCDTGRVPEAAFMARTYAPSRVSQVVALWKADLARVNKKAAEALADPAEYKNLFPDFDEALRLEQGARARGRAQEAGDRVRERGGGRRRRSAGPRRRRRGDARRRRRSGGRRGGARARNFFVAPGGTRTRAGTRARG
jgi:hypothetical protein